MTDEKEPIKVIVTDVYIPFWALVNLLIKLALAAIPAAVILGGIFFFGSLLLRAVL